MAIEQTPELAEAVEWLREIVDGKNAAAGGLVSYSHAYTLLAALPEEVTNPKPELPKKDGYYEAHDPMYNEAFVVKVESGQIWWYDNAGEWKSLGDPYRFHPYIPLKPEKPPVTAEELVQAAAMSIHSGSYWSVAVADYINSRR